MLYLYDPRTNVMTQTTYDYLECLTGKTKGNLASLKSMGRKINNINCYLVNENTSVTLRKKWYEKEKYSDEAWLTINGSENKFLISNYGRVKRVYKNKTNFLLPYQRKGQGNLWVKVKSNGKYGEYKVGHLVAIHFIRELNPGESVVRKNGILTDDFVANLEICSKQALGKMTGYKSKSKPVVQLDFNTLEVIEEFRSAREAGRKCFISYQAVLDNCNHKTKICCGSYMFMFTDEYEKRYESLLA